MRGSDLSVRRMSLCRSLDFCVGRLIVSSRSRDAGLFVAGLVRLSWEEDGSRVFEVGWSLF